MLEIYRSSEIKQTVSKQIYRTTETDTITNDCWINLFSPTEAEISKIETELNIPQEFLRYPLDEEERPRIDYDDDTGIVLVIVDVPYSRREKDLIKYETTPLGIILADKHIITVSLKQTPILDHFIENRIKDLYIPFRTRFTIQILFAVAREYLRLLRFIDKTLEVAESELAKEISNNQLYKLLELSKSLVYFASSLKSNEAVLEKLMRGRIIKLYDEDEDLLEDVVIEYKQAHEMADIYANIVSSTTDAYASIINNNVNDIMKILAAATICLTMPDLIGCFFGQNCPMPWDDTFASNPIPFFALLFGCIASVVISAFILKKKNML
ncbi:MAG: magnesium transporter CorA family protein [Clostridiales bacterium]|nr:magnesium transporter CorA family protein [Clostridiales bacterium]MBR6484846.1 magnesium transporter CorA family protein [Clostridiales bacterium]